MLKQLLKPSIKSKLIVRFGILVLIFSACMTLTFIILNKSIGINNRIINTYTPSIKKLESFKLSIINSKSLMNSWILNQTDDKHPNKEKLREIIRNQFTQSRKELLEESTKWEPALSLKLDSVFKKLDVLVGDYNQVMKSLSSFDSYNDPTVMFEINPMIQDGGAINSKYDKIIHSLDEIIATHTRSTDVASNEMTDSLNTFKYFIILVLIISIILSIVITIITVRNITKPIQNVKDVLKDMGKGILPENRLEEGQDEIGQMASTLNHLKDGLRRTAAYADKIGNGNMEAQFEPLSEDDLLGNSLLEMGKKLKKLNEEDGKRNWVATGLANFAQLLRESNDLQALCDHVLKNLVKYVNANQGSMYLTDDNENENELPSLTLVSCFAYDRKKFIKQTIQAGEGLAGQCFIEKDIIFLTDVPDNYVRITSGLGEANPRCIVIFPLVVNDKIMGVLELASFKVFDSFELEFIKRLSENIAGTISSGKTNLRTIQLLEDSKVAQHSMREKEEEMKQNLEELTATQEEMQRKENEYLTKIAELEEALNGLTHKEK